MPTVNNVRLNNLALASSTTVAFRGFFELTRAMKKAGWKYKASSDGTSKVPTANPASDQWGTGVVTNAGAAAASIATPARGRATVTGLTGIVATDKGKFLTITGGATGANNNHHQIEEILSSTSVAIDARNFAVVSDANNGALTWTIRDPLGDTFNNSSFNMNTIAWWCAQGPSILKIPTTAASTGTFSVGENIVQTTTGAEGELLGYTYYNGTGWLVLAPRLRGTGTGVFGWQTGNVVTGGRSAATATQVGTAIDYVWEVVFAKPANQTTIQILVGQFNTVAESAEMFSFCATQTGATASVHPGGGGTGNAFGAHAWVMYGTSSTPTFGSVINADVSSVITFNNANVICVDAIPEQNYTADGSWVLQLSGTDSGLSLSSTGSLLYGLQRLNNTEDGDVCVYATAVPIGTKTLYSNSRASAGSIPNSGQNNIYYHFGFMDASFSTTSVAFATWVGRGTSASEAFAECEVAALSRTQATGFIQNVTTGRSQRMVSTANPLTKYRERIWLVTSVSAPAFFAVKGSFRWMYWVSGDQITDTYGVDPGWMQIATQSGSGSVMVIGPHDGTPWSANFGTN